MALQERLEETIDKVYQTLESGFGIQLDRSKITINFVDGFQEQQKKERYQSLENVYCKDLFKEILTKKKDPLTLTAKYRVFEKLSQEEENIEHKGCAQMFLDPKGIRYVIAMPKICSEEEFAEKEREMVETLAHEIGGHVFLYENNRKLRKQRDMAATANSTTAEMLELNKEINDQLDYINRHNQKNGYSKLDGFTKEELQKTDLLEVAMIKAKTMSLQTEIINERDINEKMYGSCVKINDAINNSRKKYGFFDDDNEELEKIAKKYDPQLSTICNFLVTKLNKLYGLYQRNIKLHEKSSKLPSTNFVTEGWSTYIGILAQANYFNEDGSGIKEYLEKNNEDNFSLRPYFTGLNFFAQLGDFKTAKKMALKLKNNDHLKKKPKN